MSTPMITTGGKCDACGCTKWMHAVVYDVPEEGDISTQPVCVQCRKPAARPSVQPPQ